MKKMTSVIRRTTIAMAGALAMTGAASASEPASGVPGVSTVVFTGSDYKQDASYSYIGVVHALNGNLGSDGFLVRVFGGLGNYEYDTTSVARGNVDTDLIQVDAGLGYQIYSGGMRVSVYASGAYEDHDQSPEDLNNPVRGDEFGFRGQAEVETLAGSPFYFGAIGSYSTAFDSYWVRGRVGADVGHGIVIGPEVYGFGNEGFDQIRYGAFVNGLPSLFSLVFGGDSKMSLAVGWADTSDDGNNGNGNGGQGGEDSIYGSIGSSFTF